MIRESILALLRDDASIPDDAFQQYALTCFAYQFENNPAYRKYCERRQLSPANVSSWLDVPAVPTAAFKEAKLVAGNAEQAEAVFRTSGTTQGEEKRGSHYVLDLALYRASLLPAFRSFVMPDTARMPILSLIPKWEKGSDSSLAFMADVVMRELGTRESTYAIDEQGINYAALDPWLRARSEPVCIIGTSLAFAHWLEYLRDGGSRFELPKGSRVMDTGGFKGATRSITNEGLKLLYEKLLGVPPGYVVNEYGMTEMLSQFYDVHLREPGHVNIKRGPAWVRSVVVDPETLEPLPDGQVGLLRHYDLANLFSVCAIQTEDMARATDAGFELLGRASGAAPRGCSIAMDIFLSSVR